ncbi:MAG: Effector protein [Acidobacteria bacterium]|jgi:hypothetical protein|nr:Effector protein [Acidobacteriota bacterium]
MKNLPQPLPFEIEGDEEFKVRVRACFTILWATRSGRLLIKALIDSGQNLTIIATADSNGYCEAHNIEKACSQGEGCGSTIAWNPDLEEVDPTDRPGVAVILGKLLVHAYHNAMGIKLRGSRHAYPGQSSGVCPEDERNTIGLGGSFINGPEGGLVHVADHGKAAPSENSLRGEMGIARRVKFYPMNWPGGPPW